MSASGVAAPARAVLVPGVPALLPAHASLQDPVAELRSAVLAAVAWAVSGSRVGTGGGTGGDGAGAVAGSGARSEPARSVLLLADDVHPANRQRGVTEPMEWALGRALLAEVGFAGAVEVGTPQPATAAVGTDAVLAFASGTARRGESAPGWTDERAVPFDDRVEAALRAGDVDALAGLDVDLADELWVRGARTLRAVGGLLGAMQAEGRAVERSVDLADDPYGVAWWVVRWAAGERPGSVRETSPETSPETGPETSPETGPGTGPVAGRGEPSDPRAVGR